LCVARVKAWCRVVAAIRLSSHGIMRDLERSSA